MTFLKILCGIGLFICLLTGAVWCHDPMLPKIWQEQDVSGWWMSEKLDGVRAYWNGQQLVSKHGNPFYPPPAFTVGLPSFPLEGELWGGRNTFAETVSIVRQQHPHSGWLQLRFAIFDVPEGEGAFSRRIKQAQNWFALHPSPYAFVIEQLPVQSRDHVRSELSRIEALGGEGLVVRDPEAGYMAGRSSQILKVKNYSDAEATVVEWLPGKGKFRGKMGALLVETEDGVRFRLGSGFSMIERDNPPEPGTVITFKYYGFYPSGIPKFPSFLRVRQDADL